MLALSDMYPWYLSQSQVVPAALISSCLAPPFLTCRYVYASNNPSESIIAKRRGYGTIVSHNVPPYARAGESALSVGWPLTGLWLGLWVCGWACGWVSASLRGCVGLNVDM